MVEYHYLQLSSVTVESQKLQLSTNVSGAIASKKESNIQVHGRPALHGQLLDSRK